MTFPKWTTCEIQKLSIEWGGLPLGREVVNKRKRYWKVFGKIYSKTLTYLQYQGYYALLNSLIIVTFCELLMNVICVFDILAHF